VSEVGRREAARVILIDERSRVLLTAVRDPDDGVVVWIAPGGTAEQGETIEQTALRELAEEIDGPPDYRLIGPVWKRHFLHTFAGIEWDRFEWYFVASVAASEIRDVRETGEGAAYFESWRWWTFDELIRHEGPLAPADLASLLSPLLRGELPAEPLHIEGR
jgi:8-oxo-dGTP pyrophosphatase MutT (NUDIX family)